MMTTLAGGDSHVLAAASWQGDLWDVLRVAGFLVLVLVGLATFFLSFFATEQTGIGPALWRMPLGWLMTGAGVVLLADTFVAALWYLVVSAGVVLFVAMIALLPVATVHLAEWLGASLGRLERPWRQVARILINIVLLAVLAAIMGAVPYFLIVGITAVAKGH